MLGCSLSPLGSLSPCPCPWNSPVLRDAETLLTQTQMGEDHVLHPSPQPLSGEGPNSGPRSTLEGAISLWWVFWTLGKVYLFFRGSEAPTWLPLPGSSRYWALGSACGLPPPQYTGDSRRGKGHPPSSEFVSPKWHLGTWFSESISFPKDTI